MSKKKKKHRKSTKKSKEPVESSASANCGPDSSANCEPGPSNNCEFFTSANFDPDSSAKVNDNRDTTLLDHAAQSPYATKRSSSDQIHYQMSNMKEFGNTILPDLKTQESLYGDQGVHVHFAQKDSVGEMELDNGTQKAIANVTTRSEMETSMKGLSTDATMSDVDENKPTPDSSQSENKTITNYVGNGLPKQPILKDTIQKALKEEDQSCCNEGHPLIIGYDAYGANGGDVDMEETEDNDKVKGRQEEYNFNMNQIDPGKQETSKGQNSFALQSNDKNVKSKNSALKDVASTTLNEKHKLQANEEETSIIDRLADAMMSDVEVDEKKLQQRSKFNKSKPSAECVNDGSNAQSNQDINLQKARDCERQTIERHPLISEVDVEMEATEDNDKATCRQQELDYKKIDKKHYDMKSNRWLKSQEILTDSKTIVEQPHPQEQLPSTSSCTMNETKKIINSKKVYSLDSNSNDLGNQETDNCHHTCVPSNKIDVKLKDCHSKEIALSVQRPISNETQKSIDYNLRSKKAEHSSQYDKSDANIKVNLVKHNIIDFVTVTFHAVVSSEVCKEMVDKNASLFILFGKPISDWKEFRVQLQIQNTSQFARSKNVGYVTGEFELSRQDIHKNIPYKYVLLSNGSPMSFEILKSDYGFLDLNRLLNVVTDDSFVDKYDEGLIFNPRHTTVTQSIAILVFVSTLNAEFLRLKGISAALNVKKSIFNAHEGKMKYINSYSSSSITKSSTLKVPELERRIFSTIHNAFNQHLEMPELPESMFIMLSYFLLYVESSTITVDTLKIIISIFNTLRVIMPKVLKRNQINIDLPSLSLKIKMKKALISTANRMFYLIDCQDMSLYKDNPEDFCSWIIILSYIEILDDQINSETTLLNGIEKDKWIKLANVNKLGTVHYMNSFAIQTSSLVKQAIVSVSSDTELKDLFKNSTSLWMLEVPFQPVACKFFMLVSEDPSNEEVFTKGSSQLLTRLQIHLASLGPDNPKKKDFTSITIPQLLEKIKTKTIKRVLHIDLLLKMLKAFLIVYPGAIKDSNQCCEILLSESCKFLCTMPLKSHWSEWEQLYIAASNFGLSIIVDDSFQKKMGGYNLEDCIEIYSAWEGDNCQEIIDIIVNFTVDLLLQRSTPQTNSWISRWISRTLTGSSAKQKTTSLFSKFISKTFKNDISRKSIISLCHKADVKLFQIMAEFQNEFEPSMKHTLKKIGAEVFSLSRDLLHGNCTILEFQELFNNDNTDATRHNLNDLQTSLNALIRMDFPSVPSEVVEIFHKKVLDFINASRVLSNLLPNIEDDHSAFITADSIPNIPEPANVNIYELKCGYSDVLQISPGELETLKWFAQRYNRSSIFPKLWKDAMKLETSFKKEEDSDEDEDEEGCNYKNVEILSATCVCFPDWHAYKQSLLPVKERIQHLLASFNDKTITIRRLEEILSHIKDDDLENEIQILGVSSVISQARFLRRFRTLRKAVIAFEDTLQILGRPSFKDVSIIKAGFEDQNFGDKQIIELSEEAIKQGELFNNFAEKDVELLEAFSRCGNLIRWLRENIKSNQEFKVFLDLASISAGESDIDLGRLMVFRSSVNGFAPLLYDINEKSCLADVMDAVQTIFKNNRTNVDLKDNVIETNRLLPWIKDIQERHGSVEASSLTTVEHINSSGSFIIQCKGNCGTRWRKALKAISMNVEMAGDIRHMEHNELDELRSKLMLITVKEGGEAAVDRYTRILDNLELIAKKLSNLLDAGCHLFSEFKLDGYFADQKKVTLRVDFGHKSGILNSNIELVDGMKQLIEFLQTISDEWHIYISELREMHFSLNYFTTEQLVLLSAAFARLLHSQQRSTELDLQAAMLIRSACPAIALVDVKKRVVESYNSVQDIISKDFCLHEDVLRSANVIMAENEDSSDFRSHPLFIPLLTGSSVKENIVVGCLAYFYGKETNMEEMEEWCWNHEEDDEKSLTAMVDEVTQKIMARKLQDIHYDTTDKDISQVKESYNSSNGNTNLEGFLFSRWKLFHEQNSSDLQAKDYIPFNILAKCIEDLVAKFQSKPERNFPKYLSLGKPNLLICPEKDIHKAALMIFQADENKQCPTIPEVLICTKKTSKEQVDLLCRRSFIDKTGKIFLVLHAHRLSFEISIHAENLFTRQTSSFYKIVFISSAEGNEQSYITTAFEDYLVTAPPPPHDSVLEALLKSYQEEKTCNIDKCKHPDPDGFSLRLVTSQEYGNGKTIFIKQVSRKANQTVHVNLDDDMVEFSDIIDCWSQEWNWSLCQNGYSLFHLDATLISDMSRNDLLFSFAVLGGLADASGKLWVSSSTDVIMVELTSPMLKNRKDCPFYKLLPNICCKNPLDVLEILELASTGSQTFDSVLNIVKNGQDWIYLMNEDVYLSDVVQRPYQFLSLSHDPNALDNFSFAGSKPVDNAIECLKCLLNACPVKQPSWAELLHFSSFLNVQLQATENSVFCDAGLLGDILCGFKSFVVKFLVQMAQDFSTRSVRISDESQGEGFMMPVIEERRQWENSPHPYIFFNKDNTLSFFGFFIDQNCNLVDEKTKKIIKPKIISNGLYQSLCTQGVVFNKQFVTLTRKEKLASICTVIGADITDPDANYELTYDNVMKMLAIFMRFRSNIPVVVMGETGSGKTSLVRFMCSLQRGNTNVENMLIVKIHGGITKKHIHKEVYKAIDVARRNISIGITQTVLFFDEANTTSAISTIKTVMCDRLVDGIPIPDELGLQFVAAVNPYRKHSEKMICKLEDAGLGYHIQADQTVDKLGGVPMRRLVYRVREIPQSMFPLIWDFGTLDSDNETLYIMQMVEKWLSRNGFVVSINVSIIVDVLSSCQEYMRMQDDECSFVSLRDVDRTLKVLSWFHGKRKEILNQFTSTTEEFNVNRDIPDIISNLVLAMGVTYYVRMQDRMSFAAEIENCFKRNRVNMNARSISSLIEKCQDLFLKELQLENNIARNAALKENVWMMTLCIELKIPLFLVGKPGSSKSLAKTVVSDIMQGEQSYSPFFRKLKEIHMISFQCSPIATAAGIESTFKQSQKFQKGRDLTKFSAVVVLDEVGLAEDSEKMPLKALHPLLEDGCIDEAPQDYMKVSFIGISNWALDPAKMNRGIFVSRGVPSQDDLKLSAEGICKNDQNTYKLMRQTINKLTKGYYALYQKQEREYFGLRDFYSLIKRVFNMAKGGETPSETDIIAAVQRNFGGFSGAFDPVDFFLQSIALVSFSEQRIHPEKLIFEAIQGNDKEESRYILLLTKNNAALHILQGKKHLLDQRKSHVMFGSSFPQDKEYTSICYNINKVKIAMELGHTVILCNLNNLYESLYDALNQNYVWLGGKRYVDLGLGTHRVKCMVHKDFKLILIAEDEEVYKKFPIPLINRLEKHYLSMETILDSTMKKVVRIHESWVNRFCQLMPQRMMRKQFDFQPGDVFIGYHDDIISSVILSLQEEGVTSEEEITKKVKRFFLSCAAPDGIMRLSESRLPIDEQAEISQIYYLEQHHSSLADFLKQCPKENRLLQVTTSSRLLTSAGRTELEKNLSLEANSSTLLTLQQFESRLAFEKHLKDFMTCGKQLLIIQSDVSSDESMKLIECARFVAQEMMGNNGHNKDFRVVFIIHVQRVTGGIFPGMSVSPWLSFHIDELRGQRQHSINIEGLSQQGNLLSALEKMLVPVQELVIDSVPKAASCMQTNPSRVQRRINILLDVFKSCDSEMLEIVSRSVTKQLEGSMLCNLKKWLLNIAMDSNHLKEGNTYQRSVWLHLQEQFVSPLRTCIETLDLDNGLELLLDEDQSIVAGYQMFFQLIEHSTPRGVSSIAGSFPFSRVISNELDQLLKVANTSCRQLQSALQVSHLAEPLMYCFCNCEQAAQRFVADIAMLNFDMAKSSEKVQNYLCEEILNAASYIRKIRLNEASQEQNDNDEEEDYVNQWQFLSPSDIFFTVKNLKSRFIFFNSLLMFDPGLCEVAFQLDSSNELVFRTDVLLFEKVLTNSLPKLNELRRPGDFESWSKKVSKIISFHQTLVSLDTKDDLLPHLQAVIRQLSIINLFMYHTSKSDFRPSEATLKRLIRHLDKNSLKQKNEFDKFVKILLFANKESIKAHFVGGDNDGCVICEEDFDRPDVEPVALPCGKNHIGCKHCLETHFHNKKGEWTCPVNGCGEEIEKNFVFKSTLQCQENVENHQQFKNQLQFFFLDVLQRFVFANEPPHADITDELMSFIVTTKLDKTRTKTVSPFENHGIDASPVIRSYLLQLLLQGQNFGSATRALRSFLDQIDKLCHDRKQFQQLCLLSVYCLEDRLLEDQTIAIYERQIGLSMDCCLQMLVQQEEKGNIYSNGKFDLIFSVAIIRLCILALAPNFHKLITIPNYSTQGEVVLLLEKLNQLFFNNDSMCQEYIKTFLVRILVNMFSRGFIKEWQQSRKFLDLMPHVLHTSSFINSTDYFFVVSENYGNVRQHVRAALMGNYTELNKVFNDQTNVTLEFNLALFFLSRVEGTQATNVKVFVEQLNKLSPVIGKIANTELMSDDSLWIEFMPRSEIQKSILCFLYYFKVVLASLDRKNYLQDALFNITEQKLFPTMKQDDSTDILEGLQLQGGNNGGVTAVYRCPNCNTPFGIGECGRPVGKAYGGEGMCPECKTAVGGADYDRFLGTGKTSGETLQAVLTDQTQTGHILGTVDAFKKAKPERELGDAAVAVTQFILHAAMAVQHNQTALHRCIHPSPGQALPEFLMQHLENNLEQICRAINKSNDDVMVLLFHAAKRLSNLCPELKNSNAGLHCKKARQVWENDLFQHVIQPEAKDMQNNVAVLSNRMEMEMTAAEEVLSLILTPKSEEQNNCLDIGCEIDISPFWFPRDQLNIYSLKHTVGSNISCAKCPNLNRLLLHKDIVIQIKKLTDIICLQFKLRKLFFKKIESPLVDDKTVERFLADSNLTDSDQSAFSAMIEVYFTLFNTLKQVVFDNGKVGASAKTYLRGENLTFQSAASVLFASEHPAGQCFNALVDLLLTRHNLLLDSYASELEGGRILEEPLSCSEDISTGQLVTFEEKDLNLMLVMHSNYTLEVEGSREMTWKLNVEDLEQHVIERFFVGRTKFLIESVPRFLFRNDDVRLDPFRNKICQEHLTLKQRGQIRKELNELRDVGGVLDCLQTTLAILQRTVDSKPEDCLITKMEQLYLRPAYGGHALRGLKLCHAEGCLSFLTLLRARWMLKNKHNPYNLVQPKYHEALPTNIKLKPLVDHPQLEQIIFQLHLFMHARLKKTVVGVKDNVGMDPPEGILKDYFGAYLESIDDDKAYDHAGLFDERLLNAHAVCVFIELLEKHMVM